jgi:hypothetical protein
MANINLSQSSQQRGSANASGVMDKTLGISLGLLVLTGVVFGGVKLYSGSLEQKKANIENEIVAQSAGLQGDKVDRVADFQTRSDFIAKKMESKNAPQDILAKVEKAMLPPVVLQDYEYDVEKKTLSLEATADSFKTVSQQLMSFKAAFNSVVMDSGAHGEDESIVFSAKISL